MASTTGENAQMLHLFCFCVAFLCGLATISVSRLSIDVSTLIISDARSLAIAISTGIAFLSVCCVHVRNRYFHYEDSYFQTHGFTKTEVSYSLTFAVLSTLTGFAVGVGLFLAVESVWFLAFLLVIALLALELLLRLSPNWLYGNASRGARPWIRDSSGNRNKEDKCGKNF